MRGGYGTSDHGTLADRNRTLRPAPAAVSPEPERPAERPVGRPTSPARHCQVNGEPSLLVEWRRGATQWEGRVISVTWLGEAGGWATVERWVAAGEIERS